MATLDVNQFQDEAFAAIFAMFESIHVHMPRLLFFFYFHEL